MKRALGTISLVSVVCVGCGGSGEDTALDQSDNNEQGVAGPTDRSPTAPVRPTYQDVSIKTESGYFYEWFRGRTATQVQRDAMEETLTAVAVPEAIRYARTMTSCKNDMNFAFTQLSNITMKLGPAYEQKSILPHGSWAIGNATGRHYSIEQYILKRIRACSIDENAAAKCASNPLMSSALADLLDIRVDGGVCVAGALFQQTPPLEAFNSSRAGVGVVHHKEPTASAPRDMAPVSEMQKLHDTHAAHKASSDFRCGTGPAPTTSVKDAHMAFEATAPTEDDHHFFRMKDFSGFADAGWSSAQICQWARLQDEAHERWMDAVMAGDWGHARQADDDHQLAHICMNLKDPRLLVRFSCGADEYIGNCAVKTCEEVLADLP